MKRVFTPASFFIVFFFVLLCSSPAQSLSGPSMALPEKSFNFNEVEEGKIVEHTFKVLNKGNQPLEITNVNPG